MPDTEQEIYDSAIEQTENVPETPVEAPQEAKPERVRDEHGRFTKAATEQPQEVVTEAAPEPKVETHEDTRVPSWRLKEEADRRREAEAQLASIRDEVRNMQMQMMQMHRQAPQEPQEAPDIFADPQAFVHNLQSGFQQQLQALRLENSLERASMRHGEDKFGEAYNAFTDYISRSRDQATYQRVMASSDPGNALVQWHKDQTLQQELGGKDLKTFLDEQLEARLKDPAIQAKVIEAYRATQQAGAPSNIISTPSLSRAPSAAPAHDDGGSSPQDIYNYATRR